MDWANFFESNAQSLFTLGGVIFGALLTFFGIFINNWFQAKERDKDRQEQRRELKIQNKQKWIEHDVLESIDLLQNLLQIFSKVRISEIGDWKFNFEHFPDISEIKKMSDEEFEFLERRLNEEHDVRTIRGNLTDEGAIKFDKLGSLIFSIADATGDEEIHTNYQHFLISITEYFVVNDMIKKSNEVYNPRAGVKEWVRVLYSSGELHKVLRKKLIKVRDSE